MAPRSDLCAPLKLRPRVFHPPPPSLHIGRWKIFLFFRSLRIYNSGLLNCKWPFIVKWAKGTLAKTRVIHMSKNCKSARFFSFCLRRSCISQMAGLKLFHVDCWSFQKNKIKNKSTIRLTEITRRRQFFFSVFLLNWQQTAWNMENSSDPLMASIEAQTFGSHHLWNKKKFVPQWICVWRTKMKLLRKVQRIIFYLSLCVSLFRKASPLWCIESNHRKDLYAEMFATVGNHLFPHMCTSYDDKPKTRFSYTAAKREDDVVVCASVGADKWAEWRTKLARATYSIDDGYLSSHSLE